MKRSSFSPTDKNAQYNSKRFRTRSNENNNDNSNPDSVHAISSFTHLSNSNNSTNQIDPFLKVTKSIWAYYTKNAQGIECYQKKLELKNALMFMFEDVFPYLGVYIVGSSINGFGTNDSDVDMCFMVSREEIQQKTEALLLLKAIGKAMRRSSFIRQLNVIPAKCPIIKFHDSHNNLDCDINLNNHIGIRNTHLLKCYSDLDWRVKPIVLSIKRWAKFHEINDASQKTVSSYSFALMAIFYMQKACSPPILPCLQKLYPGKFSTKTNITTLRLNEPLEPWTSQNKQSLGEVFNGFLDYYSTFDFSNSVISVRMGELLPKDCLPKDDYEAIKSAYIKIEEPFDLSNTARSVFDYSTFQEIKNVFEKSKAMLKANKDFDCLVNKRFTDFNNSNYDTW